MKSVHKLMVVSGAMAAWMWAVPWAAGQVRVDPAATRKVPGKAARAAEQHRKQKPEGEAAQLPLRMAGRLDRYALILGDKPVAATVKSRAEMRSMPAIQRGRAILAAQETLKAALAARKIRVLSATQTLLNAVYVSAPGVPASALASLPGVTRVVRMQPVKRTLNLALGLVSVPGAWNVLGGEANAGKGVKIGIIDTGIDAGNPAFEDPSLTPPSGYPIGAGDNWQQYVNNKIIVARSYVNLLVLPLNPGDTHDVSRPDDLSPRDRVGHGTAAAMVAAGETVQAPLAQITGVAPKAYLGSYKVFGSPGVNDYTFDDVVLTALEDAFNDGMDVVSVSLSSPALWGPEDTGATCGNATGVACDPRAQAVDNAVNNGMTVVAAAGNEGNNAYSYPSYGSIGSPGTANGAITVGATYNAHIFYSSVSVPGDSSLQGLGAFFGDAPKPGGPMTAPVKDTLTLGGSSNPNVCQPIPAGSLNGSIALVGTDLDCNYMLQAINVQNAGAVAVVFYQSTTGGEFIYTIRGLQGIGIPVVMIGNSEGTSIESYISGHSNAKLTIDPTRVETDASSSENYITNFSSRGPALETEAIKPDLVATGSDLYTAAQNYDANGDMYDPSGYTVVDGTSFAAPMVAGTVAMVKQLNPSLTPAQLKSAVVNTASEVVGDYDASGNPVQAGVETEGSGLLNAAAAVQTDVTVEPATLSFGIVNGTLPSMPVTFTNIGKTSVSLSLTVNPFITDPNAQVSVSSGSFTLKPGQSTQITIGLQGNQPGPGIYEGDVVIQGASQSMHIPYLYSVSDGNIANAFPLRGNNFAGAPGDSVAGALQVEVVDDYGLPLSQVPVLFYSTIGNGTITSGTGTQGTDNYGVGYATAQIGTQLGQNEFAADIGNTGAGPLFTIYFEGRAFAQPAIASGGVVNGASFLAGQGLAPGSYISIFGSGLSETTQLFRTPYLPLSLGGMSVSFDVPSAGISVPGRLVFVKPGQVNVQVPWELAGRSSAVMKVSLELDSSNAVTVPLTAYSPAFFEYTDPSGQKLLAAQDAGYHLIGTQNPAARGSTILLYANGLGPVDTPVPSGEPTPQSAPRTTATPQVTIGGQQAQVVFSGLSPQSIALYQVNVVVPAGIGTGPQKVVMTVNGYSSQTSTIVVK